MAKTQQSSQQNMSSVIDNDGFDDLDNEIIANQTKDAARDKARVESSLYPWTFRMPDTAEADGTRKKRIRFITPYSKMGKLLIHSEFQKYSVVCPAQYGKDCQYCKKSEEEQKKFNHTWYLWQVWDYTGGRDGEGDEYVFAWEANKASPIPPLHNMMKDEIAEAKQEGRPIVDYTERDIVLVQVKAGTERSFNPIPKNPKPFSYPAGYKSKWPSPWSKTFMRDAFAFFKGKDQREELLGIKDSTNGVSQSAVIKKDTKSLLDDEDD